MRSKLGIAGAISLIAIFLSDGWTEEDNSGTQAFLHLAAFAKQVDSARSVIMTIRRASRDSEGIEIHFWKVSDPKQQFPKIRQDGNASNVRNSSIFVGGHFYGIINTTIIHEIFQDAFAEHLLDETSEFHLSLPEGSATCKPYMRHGESATLIQIHANESEKTWSFQRIVIRNSDGALLSREYFDVNGIRTNAVFISAISLNTPIEDSIFNLPTGIVNEADTMEKAVKFVSAATPSQ